MNAHEDGQLVIFVGAGASVGRPSNLPTFLGLTEKIRDECELGDVIGPVHDQPLDEVMGEIESKYDVDVHLRAMKHTSKKSSLPNSLHDAIVRLSQCGEVRIVTTNYDNHLSAKLDRTVDTYFPPALPLGNNFSGLVYLHGSVTQHPKHLIVTAADFGRAYLTEAWATRFLERMFNTYTTLFVGYSHNDVIMKYLARGLGPSTKPRYAFTHQPDSSTWTQLGIIPVGYSPSNSHRALVTTLTKWSRRAASGVLDHRRQTRELMQGRSPSDLTAEEASYLDSVIADENIVQFFCEHAHGPDWLTWTVDKPEFRTLFHSESTVSAQVTWRLARWFAQTYITPNASSDALAVCQSFDDQVSPELWDAIARRLVSMQRLSSDGFDIGPWLVALVNSAPKRSTPFLEMLLNKCKLPADTEAAVLLFSYLADPQVIHARSFFGDIRGGIRLRGDAHRLHEAWTTVFRPSLATTAGELLPIVEQLLRKAQRNVNLDGGVDSREVLGSPIHPISATTSSGSYAEDVDFLVEVARDCIEALLTHQPEQGVAHLSRWASADVILINRLAVHGWTVKSNTTAVAQANWIAEQGIVLAHDFTSEITPLLLQIVESNDEEALNVVVTDILHHASDDQYTLRRALRTLHWMRDLCQSAAVLRDAIEALVNEHHDLRALLEAIESASAPSQRPLDPMEELSLLLEAADLPSAIALLHEFAVQDPPPNELIWDRVRATLASAVSKTPSMGFDLLDIADDSISLRQTVETSVVRGWSTANVDDQLAELILHTASALNITDATHDITMMLAGFRDQRSSVEWESFAASRTLARRCWDVIATRESHDDVTDWLHSAVDSPAGHLTIYWIGVAFHDQEITAEVSQQITEMLTCGDDRAHLVEVIVGLEATSLLSLDTEWCQEHVLPLFDWTEPDRALRAWSGYLSSGRVNQRLLDSGLLDSFIDAAANVGRFSKALQNNLFGMLAAIALHSDVDHTTWLPRLMRHLDAEGRAEWANEVADRLKTMPPDDVETQWSRWIERHWSQRTQSVPCRMDFREASEMARLAIYLGQSLSSGVDLAIQHPAGLLRYSDMLVELTESRITRNPDEIARLLAHVFSYTQQPYYGFGLSDVVNVLRRLGASTIELDKIAEHALRLGISIDDD